MRFIYIISLSLIFFQSYGQSYLKTDVVEYVGDVFSINMDYEIYMDSVWTQEFGVRLDFIDSKISTDDLEQPTFKSRSIANFGILYGLHYHIDNYFWIGLESAYQYHNIQRSNFSCSSIELIGDVYKCNGYGPQSNRQKTHSFFLSPQLKWSREIFDRVLIEPYVGLLVGYHSSMVEGDPFVIFEENAGSYKYHNFFSEQILDSDLSGFKITPKIGFKIGYRIGSK